MRKWLVTSSQPTKGVSGSFPTVNCSDSRSARKRP
jgi:hypothetical protein